MDEKGQDGRRNKRLRTGLEREQVEAVTDEQYDEYVDQMRKEQYPMLKDSLYLDHAGTTLTSKALMDSFYADMISNLYGNPHSLSQASQRTAEVIDNTRLELLRLFKADPAEFDVVFTANATAAIKLVSEIVPAFTEFYYHNDAHTSMIGVRGVLGRGRIFMTDQEVEEWLQKSPDITDSILFAYPAQSNLNGRRLPLRWCENIRRLQVSDSWQSRTRAFTLLDCAGLASTTSFDLSNARSAPDFTVISLYKIFGFPDLGALVVRRQSLETLPPVMYFGGGTVDLVINKPATQSRSFFSEHHKVKTGSPHDRLEAGTLPYHSIVALRCALSVHQKLFLSFDRVQRHTQSLTVRLVDQLSRYAHSNGVLVAEIYVKDLSSYQNPQRQGPIVAFNLRSPTGSWVSNSEFEKLAYVKNINIRTGGMCNPGGIATSLELSEDELLRNYHAGYRCGSERDIADGKPLGMIRVSFGAMSTRSDVDRFLEFIDEFYVEKQSTFLQRTYNARSVTKLHVESLTIYPVKSCAGYAIPAGLAWPVKSEGLLFDRQWCIVHAGNGKVLSQKKHPKMAKIKTRLDTVNGQLIIEGNHAVTSMPLQIKIPLYDNPSAFEGPGPLGDSTELCGRDCDLDFYRSSAIDGFFTDCIGAPCRLARFPTSGAAASRRHAKAKSSRRGVTGLGHAIALSNESPILTITRASLEELNREIAAAKGKQVDASVFRANIVLANDSDNQQAPYVEDQWKCMLVNDATSFEFLGKCQRCQMICTDQTTAAKNQWPLTTLAKTRRIDGGIYFGVHTAPIASGHEGYILVGDEVTAFA